MRKKNNQPASLINVTFKLTAILYLTLHLSFSTHPQPPSANQSIIDYVDSVMGTTVDRGECWDLANRALQRIDAKWDHVYVYGQRINPNKEAIYPGDIIHFKNVKLKYQRNDTTFQKTMQNHTAIVYEVLESNARFVIAHQNAAGKRFVFKEDMDIRNKTQGTIRFYRPVPGSDSFEQKNN